MKKFIALLLAVMMVASLAACGSKTETPATQLKILDTAYTEEDYAIAIAKENEDLLNSVNDALNALIADGTVQQVVDFYISGEGELPAYQQDVADGAQVLIMATSVDFPPYEFYENEQAVGIDVVVASLIADQLAMKLDVVDTAFDSILGAVVSGKADIGMAGMTVNEERLESVNFSVTYATGVQAIVVAEDSDIASADDLFAKLEAGEDLQIGTQNGTTGFFYASDDFGEDHVQAFNKGADAIQALVTGKIDCVIIDSAPAQAFVAANNG